MTDDFEQRLCDCYRERRSVEAPPQISKRLKAVYRLLSRNPIPSEPGDYLLVVKKGDAPFWFRLDDAEATIGRFPDCSLMLDHESISGKHLSIYPKQPFRMLIDNKSTNGVYVNGERTPEHHLHDGDAIQLGPYLLVFARSGGLEPDD